ncbi:MAG: methyltransferase domain-containing protein [Myxococcales bacterium]|nr:MAG: methyltransferase domain-containing protein [Myxococcales bacterium]
MEQASFSAEVGRGLAEDELPAYAPMLDAYQKAFEPELKRILMGLPFAPGHRVLDLACGAGAYTRWIAERLGANGLALGVDLSPAFLDEARSLTPPPGPGDARVEFAEGDALALPFESGSFDASFCAQSLYSVPEPARALAEMARVTRHGGAIVVLENDLVHQFMLPWPVDLELAVRQAQLAQLRRGETDRSERFFVGRRLGALFEEAGIDSYDIRSFSLHRTGALKPAEEAYLADYLRDLAERARPFLAADDRRRLDALTDPGSPEYLLRIRGFHMAVLNQVAVGTCHSAASVRAP